MVVGLLLLAAATLIFRGRHKKNKTFKVAGLVWAILILLFCTAGCISNKYPQATTENNIHKVYIENLVNNRTKYHGATVQVRGLFGYSFETCAIFPATPDYKDGNIVYKISSFEAIWLEFDSKYIPFDSIANYDYSKMHQLITVQGVFDSTKTGHMGEYKGTIRNARIVIDN